MSAATALSSVPAEAAETRMPASRVLRAYALEAKYESYRMLRSPAFAGPFLALPVCLFLLFGVVLFGEAIAKDPKAAGFMFMGFTVMGVMGPGMFGFGITIASEREQGLLRLKRALPVPPAATLIAKMLMAMLFVALIMITMVLAAPLGRVTLGGAQMLSLSLVCIAGALPFCALGFYIGAWTSSKAAPAFVNLLYLPMLYLSGFLFPLPPSMKWIVMMSPAHHLHQIAIWSVGAPYEGTLAVHVGVLTAVTVVFTALATRRLAKVG